MPMMNAIVSLPDALLSTADEFASAQGISRDELIAQAIECYLQRQTRDDEITAALDSIYCKELSKLDPALAAAQTRVLSKDDWQ